MSAGVVALRQSESNALKGAPDSFFTGQGRDSGNTQNSKFKGKVKSKIVLTLLLGMLTAGGFFLTSSNSMLAPALSANVTEETSTQDVSGMLRSRRIIHLMLGGEDAIVRTTWTGNKKYTNFSKHTIERFEKFGIAVEGSGKNTKLKFKDKIITANDFLSTVKNDLEFREAYQNSLRSYITNFFDTPAVTFYKRFGNARNWMKDFVESPDEEKNKNNYDDTLSEHFDGNTTEAYSDGKVEKEEVDDEGNTKKTVENERLGESKSESSKTTKAEATKKARSYISDLSSKVTGALSLGCAAMRVGSTIAVTVAAVDTYNTIKYFLGNVENISKMMAGEGSNSAINQVLNFLTTPAVAKTPDLPNAKAYEEVGEIETNGAPIEATGLQLQISNIKTSAKTTEPYSLERAGNAVARAISFSGGKLAACTAAETADAVVSIAATLGTGGVAKILSSIIVETAGAIVLEAGVTAILAFLIPTITNSLYMNAYDALAGLEAGHAFANGAAAGNMTLSRNGSAQMPATKENVLGFRKVQNTVIAMNAELDRKNRSPFDITSRNTFLGSIANSLLPTIFSTRISSITALTKSTSSSLAALNPLSALADSGENSSYITTFGNCERLEKELGDVGGDLYCNPITTTDPSTLDLDPNDETYQNVISTQMESCDDKGNCVIKEDSNLDRFIKYCQYRESPFGIFDANILDEMSLSAKNKITTFLAKTPLIGDLIAIVDAGLNAIHKKWASGKVCVYNDSDDWNNEMKYYQRYVEDQRILTQLGAYEEGQNPVEMAYERYLEKHPLDNSPSGTLARMSGIRKDDAQLVLDIVAYYNFLQDYDPSTRIAMTGKTSEIKTSTDVAFEARTNQNRLDQPQPTDEATTVIALIRPTIVYADLRTRSHTV